MLAMCVGLREDWVYESLSLYDVQLSHVDSMWDLDSYLISNHI